MTFPEPRALLLKADARRMPLADASAHCCVTSPPYFGQRDYGAADQIGLEPTLRGYLAALGTVFDEVARVLRPDGTLWLNIGDAISTSRRHTGVAAGNLIGVPWLAALLLRSRGWFVRSANVWHKPNPVPDTAENRPGRTHEDIFLLTRHRSDYFYDGFAVRQAGSGETGCNLRSVWSIPVGRSDGAHFAAFPPELPGRCIRAGTSEAGACPACGAPQRRLVEKVRVPTRPGRANKIDASGLAHRDKGRHVTRYRHLGWEPTCPCHAGPPVPAIVLDPFAGSGTTPAVALSLGRSAVGLDLNPEYLSAGRLRTLAGDRPARKPRRPAGGQRDLFGDVAELV